MREKLKKLMDKHCTTAVNRLLACYLVFVCLFAVLHLGYTAVSGAGFLMGKTVQKELTVADFTPVDVEIVDDSTIINASGDSQLIYSGNIRNLIVKCSFSADPGEFVCFYNFSGNDVFGTHRMEYAKLYNGCYIFEFPLGTKQIRLDTGVEPSVMVAFDRITINKPTIKTLTGITAGDLFTLLVVPALGFMVWETILSILKKKK